jgi:hypothetical protein
VIAPVGELFVVDDRANVHAPPMRRDQCRYKRTRVIS